MTDSPTDSQNTDRLTKAVEAFKEQPQSTDKKTAFWTAYKKLADEFDEEFQSKYRNDLDSSLIFVCTRILGPELHADLCHEAGLFSAVTSAFIIQIQPELQPDPNMITQGLLGLLVHNITGLPLPPALLPPPATPAKMVIVAQGILYASLFLTLLVALLAVLGKEWLQHYNSVGEFERGTIKQRGVKRQRKFDGIRDWKFEFFMKMFPLLLQFSLLLFATALSIYLWTIHHAIASIVLGLTALGIILYTIMIISALISQFSPFQTSLTLLLRTIFKGVALRKRLAQNSWKFVHTTFAHLWSPFSQCWSAGTIAPLLPCFHNTNHNTDKPDPSEPTEIFNSPDSLQPLEVAAVIWAMETSTDPAMVHSAAEMVSELQWPVNLDVRPSLKRLFDTFHTCIEESTVLNGMEGRAIACIKAFGVLEMVTDQPEVPTDLGTFPWKEINTTSAELQSLVLILCMKQDRSWPVNQPPHLTQWSLRFMAKHLRSEEGHLETIFNHFHPDDVPENGESILADYLFCLNSFFIPTAARDRSLLNKSKYLGSLTALLFENLAKPLVDRQLSHQQITIPMLKQMSQIVDDKTRTSYIDTKCINAAYCFCATPGLPEEAIMWALHLVRIETAALQLLKHENQNVEWVYRILADHHDQELSHAFVGDLLLVLIRYRLFLGKPPIATLRALLLALSAESDNSNEPHDERNQVARRASFVLCSAYHWFQDKELGPMLMEDSVWRILSRHHLPEYTILAEKLLLQPEWRKIILQYPAWWLNQYPWIMGHRGIPNDSSKKFRSVLSREWDVDSKEADTFGEEKTLVMMFMVLVNAWGRVDFFDAPATLSLLECTVKMSFSVRVLDSEVQDASQRFLDVIMGRLGNAVARAAERAIQVINNPSTDMDLKEGIREVPEFLSRLALKINGELRNPEKEYTSPYEEATHWEDLRETFYNNMVALRKTRVKGGRSVVL